MSITPQTIRTDPASRLEPSIPADTSFRERVASRSAEHAALSPRAVDLEARLLTGVHGALHGTATELRGIHSARRWQEALFGKKHVTVADVCRIATHPGREARAAMLALVTELALVIGYRLEPIAGAAGEAHAALAEASETASAVIAELARDLADGKLDASEARDLRPELNALKSAAARIEAVMVSAENAGARGVVPVSRVSQ